VLEFPVDHPRSIAPMSRGAAHAVTLPKPLTQALKALGQQEGRDPLMTLLAAFQVCCIAGPARRTSSWDLVRCRPADRSETREADRVFRQHARFRGDLTGQPTFAS
jgi:hypothetical protein